MDIFQHILFSIQHCWKLLRMFSSLDLQNTTFPFLPQTSPAALAAFVNPLWSPSSTPTISARTIASVFVRNLITFFFGGGCAEEEQLWWLPNLYSQPSFLLNFIQLPVEVLQAFEIYHVPNSLFLPFITLIYFTYPGEYLHHTPNDIIFLFNFIKVNWKINCIYLKYIMQWFNIRINCGIFTTMELTNISITSHNYL